ncbi:MAG TPA: BRCT domain-containing protein [Pirellulaceae bacterium]|nr:BRCT domain-containing protein [Pirellulaceae bacterium]
MAIDDRLDYIDFCRPGILDRSINSLIGILEGISIDGRTNQIEVGYLKNWIRQHERVRTKHPFVELLPSIDRAIADEVITDDERADLLWLCRQLASTRYYDRITADMQRLHAVVGGICVDGIVTPDELRGLRQWLDDHDHLRRLFPYEEISTHVTQVMRDGKVDPDENALLVRLFALFAPQVGGGGSLAAIGTQDDSLLAVCATCPEIEFDARTFCFTGEFAGHSQDELQSIVVDLGGRHVGRPSGRVDFLVVGSMGNPCWAYAAYGRKVEEAVELRRGGAMIQIVHENDFLDCLRDLGL